ncbi:regulatory LuxR family protein [Krasilnikovia cinnamomea]|uniref:Regulatory LuxR family protein n=1 Tax=Krasilnikovia cinnamomea TaxID=349313 RepID=A0A4Q7ZTV5_9ACTN|nr:LuxR family transcriptional regulator [Krasilnikovia cinnamomea]RZU53989.1 regulatory LuxR family protein [Krasilnikovia cinnamomea]
MTVVVGVDGAGRTRRLGELAAATGRPVVPVVFTTVEDLDALLARARADGALVVVDDAHRLPPEPLRALAAAARAGLPMAMARRPTIGGPELADLDEALAATGPVEHLGPLAAEAMSTLVSTVLGRAAPPEQVAAVHAASAGLPAVAVLVAADPDGTPPALVARLQRRLAGPDRDTAELALILALGLDLGDDTVCAAARLDPARAAAATRSLRDQGLLTPDAERMIPAVARAVLADLSPPERRRLHDTVAGALLATDADPVRAAEQLRAARARTATAADVFRRAADLLRFTAPERALSWYDEALNSGADPAVLAAGRAEAAVLLGLPVDLDAATGGPSDAARLAMVAGAAAAFDGRPARAAEALLGTGPPGPVLAVPALMATGQPGQARTAATGPAPLPLRRLAEAALAVGDPASALPPLIEAAEAYEQVPPAVLLPDLPHALGALVAVTAGDTATAEHLLERALSARAGGPAAQDRHRTLLAWARMRAGRYDTALAELDRLAGTPLPGRERLTFACLTAGIARRRGDIAQLRAAWALAEPVLARRAVDLFHLEMVEELLVAAARLRHHRRITPILDDLDALVDRLGRPAAWAVSLGWIRLQIAIVGEDQPAATAAADHLESLEPAGARQRAQCRAAVRWAAALTGDVPPDDVLADAADLVAAELPWEASRLLGQAAIRTDDPSAARRLLERARELSRPEAAADESPADGGRGSLSDREVEVAQLVLAGRTHREIGAQLYLSPKTVEHHVARIRAKLGAGNRAEMIAALRSLLPAEP